MISTGMVDSMYMVHAHGMGYDKLMTKISREFEGYVPIKELQRRIALDVESDNRSQAFTDFTTKNAHVFGEEKQPRRERQANAASGRAPRDRSKPQSSQATPSSGGTGKALTGTDRVNVCHNFLMDKCDYGKECKFEHRKIKVPGAACSKFLQGNTCDGSCGKLHEKWSVIITKINKGEISALKGSTPPPKKAEPTSTTTTPSTPNGRGKGGGRGGRNRGRGGKGGQSRDPSPATSLEPPAANKSSLKKTVVFGDAAVCNRCGKPNHVEKDCYTNWHADGTKLTSPKPAPVPPQVAQDRVKRYAASQQPGMPATGVVQTLEFAAEMAQYRELAGRHINRITEVNPQIQMMEGNISNDAEVPPTEHAIRSSTEESVRGTTQDTETLAQVTEMVNHEPPALEVFCDSSGTTDAAVWSLIPQQPYAIEGPARQLSNFLESMPEIALDPQEVQDEVQYIESHFRDLVQISYAESDLSQSALRTLLKNACEGHSVQVALFNSMPAAQPEGVWEVDQVEHRTQFFNVRDHSNLTPAERLRLAAIHDQLYPSDSDDNPEDQNDMYDDVPPLIASSDSEEPDEFSGDSGYSSDESEEDEGEPRIYLVSATGGLTPLNRL
jgi:hypothetical protein